MVLLLLCKEALFTLKKFCYIKPKIIVYKVCGANSIPANLRNYNLLNSLDFTKFSLTKVTNLVYVIFKNIRCKMASYNIKSKWKSVRTQTKIKL